MHRHIALMSASLLFAALTAEAAGSALVGSLTVHLTPRASPALPVACPAGSPADSHCDRLTGSGSARGLGAYSANATLVNARRASGGFDSTISGSVASARGTLEFTGDNSGDARGNDVYAITLTGSSGLASATGRGTLNFVGAYTSTGTFVLDTTIDASGVAFDLTQPTLTLGKTTARALGHGRYAVKVRYAAADASDALTASLLQPGTAKPLSSGPATGIASAVIRVKGAGHVFLRLTVTDNSANSTTRTIVVPRVTTGGGP